MKQPSFYAQTRARFTLAQCKKRPVSKRISLCPPKFQSHDHSIGSTCGCDSQYRHRRHHFRQLGRHLAPKRESVAENGRLDPGQIPAMNGKLRRQNLLSHGLGVSRSKIADLGGTWQSWACPGFILRPARLKQLARLLADGGPQDHRFIACRLSHVGGRYAHNHSAWLFWKSPIWPCI